MLGFISCNGPFWLLEFALSNLPRDRAAGLNVVMDFLQIVQGSLRVIQVDVV